MEDASDTPLYDEGRPSLLYTVAFDPPGRTDSRHMAKMLGSSVARTLFSGEMLILHNFPAPVFMLGRQGISEESVATPSLTPSLLAEHAREWRMNAADSIDASAYEWIVFLEPNCLCLRNPDHLLVNTDCDILYQPEAGRRISERTFNGYLTDDEIAGTGSRQGIYAGTWAVRGRCYGEVMKEWSRLQNSEPLRETENRLQSAWNRLMLDAAQYGWQAAPFEAHEIQFPLGGDKDWKLYKDAAIVQCTAETPIETLEFMFGLYVQKFYSDPAWSLLNLVDM